ncbi:EamA family transporter [Nostoc ellipsosporum NOK]|nr:EamA family transporter [Nostoc ellipsosporum NOK]
MSTRWRRPGSAPRTPRRTASRSCWKTIRSSIPPGEADLSDRPKSSRTTATGTARPKRSAARRSRLSARTIGIGVCGALIGTGMGMSLIMAALAGGEVGIVSTLSSLSPVLVLPMVWRRTRHRPPEPAWAGAVLAFACTSLIALG